MKMPEKCFFVLTGCLWGASILLLGNLLINNIINMSMKIILGE